MLVETFKRVKGRLTSVSIEVKLDYPYRIGIYKPMGKTMKSFYPEITEGFNEIHKHISNELKKKYQPIQPGSKTNLSNH